MPRWQKITVAGVGLLGGSIGMAAKQRRLARSVSGLVRRPESIAECVETGAVDEAFTDPARAVEGADLVLLCTPIAQMPSRVAKFLPALKRGAIVTDVGSVKGGIVSELEPLVAGAGGEFIGSHPMAGSEKMGVSAARADLFEGAVCIVTPTVNSSAEAVRKVEEFWKDLGGLPIEMSAEQHDDLVSRSSHLPHVVAAELANYVLSPVHPKEQAMLCATGFRDTTRVASGSPEMWRDIALANRKNLARVLGVFIEDLQEFQHALETQDSKAIQEFFRQAKERRDAWRASSASQSSRSILNEPEKPHE
jgi:prephenate dehydrogenase